MWKFPANAELSPRVKIRYSHSFSSRITLCGLSLIAHLWNYKQLFAFATPTCSTVDIAALSAYREPRRPQSERNRNNRQLVLQQGGGQREDLVDFTVWEATRLSSPHIQLHKSARKQLNKLLRRLISHSSHSHSATPKLSFSCTFLVNIVWNALQCHHTAQHSFGFLHFYFYFFWGGGDFLTYEWHF